MPGLVYISHQFNTNILIMKKALQLLGILICISGISNAQEIAKGTVYLDANANGKKDRREKGIEGVSVSNGKEVVLTDKEGKYELPVDNDDIIFVIKPSEYNYPVNESHLPQYYYIHKPEGSPELKFNGVPPTGPLPKEINFALLKGEMMEDYSILVFGDPQPYTLTEVDYFDRDIVNELVGVEGYQFGLSLGDIVGDDLSLNPAYIESVARIGIPWFNVYGNHDMNLDAEFDEYADESWEATYGPATYALNHGKVHYVVLDNVIFPRNDGSRGYIGGFTEQQFTFLENDLKFVPKDHLIILSFHIPVVYHEELKNSFRAEDQARLFDILKDYPHTLSLSAHTHMQGLFYLDDTFGWEQEMPHIHYNVGTTSGDWWSGSPDEDNIPPTIMRDGTPNGYAMLHFTGNEFQLEYKAAREDASLKMNLWGPQVLPQNEWFSSELYVNYFLGSDSTIVEYSLDDTNEWHRMSRTKMGDPIISNLRQEWDSADEILPGKRPSNPQPSSHLWKTGIPKNVEVGEHTMHIRVTDPLSGVHTKTYTYRIEKRD